MNTRTHALRQLTLAERLARMERFLADWQRRAELVENEDALTEATQNVRRYDWSVKVLRQALAEGE